jgi:uncharacterized protein (UPF0212 family)
MNTTASGLGTNAVLAVQKMAQSLLLQMAKIDEALKNQNLDAIERNVLTSQKAKCEHDLNSIRAAASTGNVMGIIQAAAQFSNAANNQQQASQQASPAMSSGNTPSKLQTARVNAAPPSISSTKGKNSFFLKKNYLKKNFIFFV